MQKLILGIILIAGLGVVVFSSNKKSENVEEFSESENSVESESFSEATTLLELTKKGGNYECSVASKTPISDTAGTVYISKNKIKGEFVSKVSIPALGTTKEIDTKMISDGESVYTWSSMSSDGYKAPVVENSTNPNQSSGISTTDTLQYNCKKWKPDESKFKIPNDITFRNL